MPSPATTPPRFNVTEDDIRRVVARFYREVRAHDTLGPVFAAHVRDWPAHEEKICMFWRNAILHHKVYNGNPMQVHMRAGNIKPGMFTPWLRLFDASLHAELSETQATAWSALARKIATSLRAGVSDVTRPGQIPVLR